MELLSRVQPHLRHLPIRRSAVLADRFLFHRNTISYEKKKPLSVQTDKGESSRGTTLFH